MEFVPYLWMGCGGTAWLELPPDASHAALVAVADRLCREFDGVVTERYPEHAADDSKEYWWIRVSGAKLLLMRKPPRIPVGLSAEQEDIALLVRIAQRWGVTRFVAGAGGSGRHGVGGWVARTPNQTLQQTTAAILAPENGL
jgi:hypothetical protein